MSASLLLLPLLLLMLVCRVSYIVADSKLAQPALSGGQERGALSEADQLGLLNNVTDWEIIPHPGLANQFFNTSRRTLGSFRVCALCTCCGGRRSANGECLGGDTHNTLHAYSFCS
ncbi:hypothetical protein GOP47_0022460 [Adiantum capillus-veneris]|uniref:Uncharacterized protein n=1 Tax=Adiantum capillus-veneris TaxID=13818 RepID=A0A9D4U7S8_ADICA|nr:hypothetical protein GOP47_0022460 [Adiantum capillus-veneris]